MSAITLEAQSRSVLGKGASRRLRRIEELLPAIVYGSAQPPQLLALSQHKVHKALENEAIYSSVFDLHIDGKPQQVILKDLQRHPYKSIILHMDFQRVSAKDVLVKMIPLHFMHAEEAPGFKAGGVVNHALSQVEVRCEARYLPEFIAVDLIDLALDAVLHLSDLKLPPNVSLTADLEDSSHNHPVVGIHINKAALLEEALEAEEAAAAAAESIGATEEGVLDNDTPDADPEQDASA